MRGIRILANIATVLALSLLGYSIVQSRLPAGGATAEPPTTPATREAQKPLLTAAAASLVGIRPNSRTEFAVVLTNTGTLPARLIGIPSLCRKDGCLNSPDVLATIPAEGSRTIRFRFYSRDPGSVSMTAEAHFDLATGSIVTIPVHVVATVAEPSLAR